MNILKCPFASSTMKRKSFEKKWVIIIFHYKQILLKSTYFFKKPFQILLKSKYPSFSELA